MRSNISEVKINQKYGECLNLIVSKDMDYVVREIINVKDQSGDTPLHYATRLWSQDTVGLLLKKGAKFLIKNNHNEVAMKHITPETLESYLNEQCLDSEGKLNSKGFCISANYNFLLPPDGQQQVSEMEALWNMSQSNEHQRLLKHPIIGLFLWMKWNRIKKFYFINLVLYILFTLVLTCYIFHRYGGISDKTCEVAPLTEWKATYAFYWLTVIFTLPIVVRECLQVYIMTSDYCKHPENYLEILLILDTVALLVYGWFGCHIYVQRHLATVAILLSWWEAVTMIGRNPAMGTFTSYVTMYYRVAKTFFWFLAW